MSEINRRVLLAMAASASALPAFAQETDEAPAEASPVAPIEIRDFAIGDPNAPVKIIEYASFICPACKRFHAETFKPLKAEFIDTGKVYFSMREVYPHPYAFWAAQVARCDDLKRYEGIANMVFDKQAEWTASDDGQWVQQQLRTFGLTAGLTVEQLDACLTDRATGEAMLLHSQKSMEADGVTGTPTLVINGVTYSNMAYADLKAIIEEALAG